VTGYPRADEHDQPRSTASVAFHGGYLLGDDAFTVPVSLVLLAATLVLSTLQLVILLKLRARSRPNTRA